MEWCREGQGEYIEGEKVVTIVKKVTTVEDTVDLIETDLTPIQEFYNKSNVFITGCTGFLGQLLIEKLFRSCPISKVYLLVRDKKGKTVDARLDTIFGDPLFQRLRNQMPDFRKKSDINRRRLHAARFGFER
ncbi:hypothetical protein NQ318_011803 [Aromia moschata]|uniref:Fatty acyl-CoA reductase n=1 Tax=Aromia moschata TaxID=1265417 RepID=A0AAV8Y6R9_9CUCU|nr:hypothetical protein NQ318_011803 [Aromia moschata]